MEGPAFRRALLQAASGRADAETRSALRVELRDRFASSESTTRDGGDPAARVCPACKRAIDEPTLPQHISAGCPALE